MTSKESLIRDYEESEQTIQRLREVEQEQKVELEQALSQLKRAEHELETMKSNSDELKFRIEALSAYNFRCATDVQTLEGQTQQVKLAARAIHQRGARKSEQSEHELRMQPSVQEACGLVQEAMCKRLEATCPAFAGSSDEALLQVEPQPAQAAGTMNFDVEPSAVVSWMVKGLASVPAATID
eukprot:CAMPEP_0118953284 /NCGR_PEP_ID=MMETSP1169-20130426/56310_1 /TAXON_ID=36882 /ORGANISM="Pyramimonas obovata, Strain CCMP722" /LENGTH=182 /DNA_ID=CAMNT_0006900709 /DNA_START=8 /DNA_END=553 /DNA_ORIENTATION=-